MVVVKAEFVPSSCDNDSCQCLVCGQKGKVVSFFEGDARIEFGDKLRRVGRKDFSKLEKVKKEAARNYESELKRMMSESGAAFEAHKLQEALQFANAAVDSLE